MGLYVRIAKTEASDRCAKYHFTSDGTKIGLLLLDKQTGEIDILEPLPGDESGAMAARASARLRKEWRYGKLPDLTEWAS